MKTLVRSLVVIVFGLSISYLALTTYARNALSAAEADGVFGAVQADMDAGR